MTRMTEVWGLWRKFLAERGRTTEEYEVIYDTKEGRDLWWEFWQGICEQDEREKQELEQAIAEMPESFKNLPLRVDTYSDTRPEDSWVDPATDGWETTLAAGLAETQIGILHQLTESEGIQPTKFGIDVRHIYHEFRSPHYRAWVDVGCWDKNGSYHKLIEKHEETYAGYAALRNKTSWIP